MQRSSSDSRLPSQESLLRDFAQRLGRHRQGRRAVHIHLSRLRPYNRRGHHLRIAANTFESLVTAYEGSLFQLNNADIMFICKGASVADLDAAVVKVRYLFSEDPVTQEDRTGQQNQFCTWYDLAQDYDAFLKQAEAMFADQEKRRSDSSAATARPVPQLAPLDPAELGKIIGALTGTDLSNVMRRQPVCALIPNQPPQIVFHELYVSIAGLQQVIAPGYDLATNRWLFQYLTETLDKRMLALVQRGLDSALSSRFSLNLNVATLLSPEFLAFDGALKASARGTLVLELQAVDIFADMNAYIFARDFARERGYRLCLDGLSHLSSGLIDRAKLELDLIKILWSRDMLDDPSGHRHDEFKKAIATAGEERVILTRCDTAEAVRLGESFGIHMFQGRYIDTLVEKSKKILPQ